MERPTTHAMMPEANHDELVAQLFVRDLKTFIATRIEPVQAQLTNLEAQRPGVASSNDSLGDLRHHMFERRSFRDLVELKRQSQNAMWRTIGESVDRQRDALNDRARIEQPLGSVRVDPDFEPPEYITKAEIHLMPGGYAAPRAGDDVSQGALMDRGGAVYMLGRNGGLLNDVRGHTAMAHVRACYPDLDPRDILDMGCGVGASTIPAKQCFPDAEVHGIDVGASILRYAHARAEALSETIHFSQRSAEQTGFPDASFDLVYTCVVMHETSQDAVAKILAESRRLLRPNGVAVHLEVPTQQMPDAWSRLSADLECRYNNEPYWAGALTGDYATLMRTAGFRDISVGYQQTTFAPRTMPSRFTDESEGVFRSWFVASGRA